MASKYLKELERLTYDLTTYTSLQRGDYNWRNLRDKVDELDRKAGESIPSFLEDKEVVEADLLEPDFSKGSPK